MSTTPAEALTPGDGIIDPATGNATTVLRVAPSPYLAGDVDVQTTHGDYTATPGFPVTVLD